MRPCLTCGSRSRNCICRLEDRFKGTVVAEGEDVDELEDVDGEDSDGGREPGEPPSGEWSPNVAKLREGETRDLNSHAQRNLEQIEIGVETGHIDPADAETARDRILDDLDEHEEGGE